MWKETSIIKRAVLAVSIWVLIMCGATIAVSIAWILLEVLRWMR